MQKQSQLRRVLAVFRKKIDIRYPIILVDNPHHSHQITFLKFRSHLDTGIVYDRWK